MRCLCVCTFTKMGESREREGGRSELEDVEVNEMQRCGLTRVRVRTSGLNSVEKVIC